MLTNIIIFTFYILSIYYALNVSKNSKLRILLIIISSFFILIFFSLLIANNFIFNLLSNLVLDKYIFLISLSMYFIIVLSIYIIRELKSIREKLTNVSRKLALRKTSKK